MKNSPQKKSKQPLQGQEIVRELVLPFIHQAQSQNSSQILNLNNSRLLEEAAQPKRAQKYREMFRSHSSSVILADKAKTAVKEELLSALSRIKKLEIEHTIQTKKQQNLHEKLNFHKMAHEELNKEKKMLQNHRESKRKQEERLRDLAQQRRLNMQEQLNKVKNDLLSARQKEQLMVKYNSIQNEKFINELREKQELQNHSRRDKVLTDKERALNRVKRFQDHKISQVKGDTSFYIKQSEVSIEKFSQQMQKLQEYESQLLLKLNEANLQQNSYQNGIHQIQQVKLPQPLMSNRLRAQSLNNLQISSSPLIQ